MNRSCGDSDVHENSRTLRLSHVQWLVGAPRRAGASGLEWSSSESETWGEAALSLLVDGVRIRRVLRSIPLVAREADRAEAAVVANEVRQSGLDPGVLDEWEEEAASFAVPRVLLDVLDDLGERGLGARVTRVRLVLCCGHHVARCRGVGFIYSG